MTLGNILEWLIKGLVWVLVLLGGFAYLTYYERRALARIQNRIGPNRAGPLGLLQPIADAIKLIFNLLAPCQCPEVEDLVLLLFQVDEDWMNGDGMALAHPLHQLELDPGEPCLDIMHRFLISQLF